MGGWIWVVLALCGSMILLFSFLLSIPASFRLRFLPGTGVFLLFTAMGGLLTILKDPRHDTRWFGHRYSAKDALVVALEEPLVEKAKSFKANAAVKYILHKGEPVAAAGTIILYFKKDSPGPGNRHITEKLTYGSEIIISRELQEIRNAGNPGGFDYKRYSLFHGITHQVFLKQDDFEILPGSSTSPVQSAIYASQKKILGILRRNIPGEKELSLAEALLIGYKDDLEQSLVQSYTNTGVVHIIAISGLHLGLIYWLLSLLFKPLKGKKKLRWVAPLLTISGLWVFSLLAGAQPSVLRSAFMFTLIVLGENLNRKSHVYNTMAVSAFLLLCINPFWLWDVGFQLSYAAVLSILLFMRPVYNWFNFENKILDFAWKLNAVTLAAQVLTLPLSIYHFHQFPVLFLLTNFIAVPLSSIILISEILLCTIAFIPAAASLAGKFTGWCIWLMNTYIERVELIPGSLWDKLQVSITQTILLVLFIAGMGFWLLEKQKKGLVYGLLVLLGFTLSRSVSFIRSNLQRKVIVYNVPQKRAIDLVEGRNYYFAGDTDLLEEGFARNFHLKPSRILFRLRPGDGMPVTAGENMFFSFSGKRIMLLSKPLPFQKVSEKIRIDLLVLSKNPKLYLKQLVTTLDIRQIVFDASTPSWKVQYWKRDCDSLHIPWYDVKEKGAFVMNL